MQLRVTYILQSVLGICISFKIEKSKSHNELMCPKLYKDCRPAGVCCLVTDVSHKTHSECRSLSIASYINLDDVTCGFVV